jgi:hypothetical protein
MRGGYKNIQGLPITIGVIRRPSLNVFQKVIRLVNREVDRVVV